MLVQHRSRRLRTVADPARGAHVTGRVVFVTGASRGFGEATARELARRGNTVVATMRTPERDAPKVCAGFEEAIHPVRLDVTDAEAVVRVVDEAVDTWGRIDAVINNAGYGLYGAVEELTEE